MLRVCMEILRFLLTLTRPFSDKVLDVIYGIFMGPTKPLPPIKNKILLLTANQLAEKIRKKQITCEEVMAAYIARTKEVDPILNACVDERFDDALKDAVALDRLLASGQKSEEDIARDTPLLGVPFTCKEGIGVKDMAQTKGLLCVKGRKAPSDSETVALYRKAGAIPVVVTNVPELCMWWESDNHIFGMTRNPYDHRRTVGGSTGGEGSIITAAGALIGIGTDIAGSIRIPSSFCGIYGHKPSRDIVSNQQPWPEDEEDEKLDEFVSTGPMCRYVDDISLLVKVLAGENADKLRLNEQVDFRRVKFYYIEEFPGFMLSATPDIKAAVRKAAKHFEDEFGVTAMKLDIEELRYGFEIWECKLLEICDKAFRESLSEDGKDISICWEFMKSIFRCSEHTLPALYFAAVDRRNKDKFYYRCLEMYKDLQRKLEEVLDGDAILFAPTHPEPPPHYLMTIPKYPNISYTCIFSILGYPVTQIPTGLSNGLPIGIQAISKIYKDHLTIATAVELDKVFNGWIVPCPIAV